MEWSTEKPADPIELRVYAGADGDFTLYEDENDNYITRKAPTPNIPLHWDDAHRSLTIGERPGSFPGMLADRTFRVVFVGNNHGAGVEPAAADREMKYAGRAITANF